MRSRWAASGSETWNFFGIRRRKAASMLVTAMKYTSVGKQLLLTWPLYVLVWPVSRTEDEDLIVLAGRQAVPKPKGWVRGQFRSTGDL